MSRTVRARKKTNKREWWNNHRHYWTTTLFGYEIYDGSILYRADKTRKPTKWTEWVHRDGNLSESYRAYWWKKMNERRRAEERRIISNIVGKADEDQIFPLEKDLFDPWYWD